MRSMTDASIVLGYNKREILNTFVKEYNISLLDKTIILVIKLNQGDMYLYKGTLKSNEA